MRFTPLAVLAFVGVTALTILSLSPARAAKPPAASPLDDAPFRFGDGRTLTFTVHGGYQASSSRAMQDALGRAQAELVEQLRSQSPPVEWTPPTDFVSKLVKSSDEKKFDDIIDSSALKEKVGPMYQFTLNVEVTPDAQREILKNDRAFRGGQRMLVLGKVLAGLVVALAAVAGFIRLDEWTKGYLTNGLRIGAIGLILAAVAALILA
jgi:hypothetical protein